MPWFSKRSLRQRLKSGGRGRSVKGRIFQPCPMSSAAALSGRSGSAGSGSRRQPAALGSGRILGRNPSRYQPRFDSATNRAARRFHQDLERTGFARPISLDAQRFAGLWHAILIAFMLGVGVAVGDIAVTTVFRFRRRVVEPAVAAVASGVGTLVVGPIVRLTTRGEPAHPGESQVDSERHLDRLRPGR